METSDDSSGNIRVLCRFRPLNEKEKAMAENICVDFGPDSKTVMMRAETENSEPLRFVFDYVFDPSTVQSKIYKVAASPIVDAVMQGYNGTIFAYGQTSSGKTFTMTGVITDPELMGIIPRMVGDVFAKINNADEHIEFTVKVGYCEIYMEKIKDLLDPRKNNLKIHEDKARGVYIEDLTESYVTNDREVYELMRIGTNNREVAYTHMNAGSSRSHSLFCVTITQTNKLDMSTKSGKFYLVDLAGSEKVGKTGAEGKRLEEAKNINKSLTALGQVINALTDGKSSHVPYRDSKLTRVLQDSLGGNSKTTLIIACSPHPYNEAETLSTLRFGIRAKSIKNKAKVNKEYTVAELKLMLTKAKEEIMLKDKRISVLEQAVNKSGILIGGDEESSTKDESELEISKVSVYDDMIQELEDTRARLSEEVDMNSKLRQEIEIKTKENEEIKGDYDFLNKHIGSLQEKLTTTESTLAEKEEHIEQLIMAQEYLRNDISSLNEKKNELEQTIIKKDEEILKWKTQPREAPSTVNIKDLEHQIQVLRAQLQEEQKKSKELIARCEHLERRWNEQASNAIPNLDKIKEYLREEAVREEQTLWNEEKQTLMNDFQAILEKSAELQIELNETKENYSTMEQALSEEVKKLRSKNESLEKSFEQSTLNSHNLFSQLAESKIQKQVVDRKLANVNEKCLKLEAESKKDKEKLAEAEKFIKDLYAKYEEQNIINRVPFGSTIEVGSGSTRIRKSIKGGKATIPIGKNRSSDADTEAGSKPDFSRPRLLTGEHNKMFQMPYKDNCKPF
ncbi:unnamed protein product [Blepharisma stoltei]|uniref:Kinesin-like protein n=1 Tax=Blepharisma stoltei TaxID=1481888 RepID=A0AAU9J5R1_9CILI|nr:unnamed protein product [Blepharisma stoltei]